MWSIKTIVVPSDLSKPSECALDAAIDLAQKFDASLVIAHVYQIPAYAYLGGPGVHAYLGGPGAPIASHLEFTAKKQLEGVVASARSRGVPVTTVLREGTAWEQILRISSDSKADLVIMGSRGLHGISRAMLGSTAERVVRHSPVPVMVVHGPLPTAGSKNDPSKGADALVEQWLI